jgi:hypothetical protein
LEGFLFAQTTGHFRLRPGKLESNLGCKLSYTY